MSTQHCVVMITTPDEALAKQIADALVDARLAACVQTTPINSAYRWDGTVQRDDEIMLLAKTRSALFDQLAAKVGELHPYDVPEIIALPIIGGSADYLQWLDSETAEADN